MGTGPAYVHTVYTRYSNHYYPSTVLCANTSSFDDVSCAILLDN